MPATRKLRLKSEIQAEKMQAGTAHDSIKTLQLFEDYYVMNQNNKERIQAILPRIISSVICQVTDKKRGIGKLKIGLSGRPFNRGENAELWNKTLQKIADECYNNKVLENISGRFATKTYEKRKPSSGGGVPLSSSSNRRYYSNSVLAQGNSCDPKFFSEKFGPEATDINSFYLSFG